MTRTSLWGLGARFPGPRFGILGLGVGGICSAICPDQHFREWWSTTAVGGRLSASGGLALSALCFGLASSIFFGAIAAFAGVGRRRIQPLLPAAMLLLLLSPGVALQSFDTSWAVFWSWLLGTAAGAYVGVATGIRMRAMFSGA